MLEIRLFGAPVLIYEGQPWKMRRRLARCLLYYLAANNGIAGRSSLAGLFWPDLSEEEARRNLRDILGKLRSTIPDPSLVFATPQNVFLDLKNATIDVAQFRELLNTTVKPAWTFPFGRPLPATVYRSLVEAASLWRGTGFLAGVDMSFSEELDVWLLNTGRALENQYLDVLKRLIAHERATWNLSEAVRWLNQALKVDQLNEELHSLLLKTLLESGQRAEARKHYEYLQQLSDREQQSLFSEEIQSLKNDIYGEPPSALLPDHQNWPIHPTIYAPYVGQESVLAQLEKTYTNGGGIIVYGEAGSGKTRLVQEFFNHANPRPRLLLTTCYSHQTGLPFYPWIELLRSYGKPEEWKQLPAHWASLLVMLVPELASLRSDLQPVLESSSTRARQGLFEAIHQTLIVLTKKGPCLLFLDDVHWADESSFDLLVYLMEHSFFTSHNRILVLAARTEEPNPMLARFLQAYPRQRIEQAYLSRLDEADVTDLAFYVLGKAAPTEFTARLARDSGGNPFFILETLQEILNSTSALELSETASLPLSRTVTQLIRNRLQRLSQGALEILQIAAVLGNRFDANVLEYAGEYSGERFIQALEELQKAHLVEEVKGAEHIEYLFVHEKIRESLLQGLTSLRARRLHLKAARALEQVFPGKTGGMAAVLAQHYADAGEISTAFDHWVRAASHAYHLTSIKETLYALNKARQLIPSSHALQDEQLFELYSMWSEIVFSLDDTAMIEQVNRELLEFGQERNSDLLTGTALDGLSDYCFSSNQFEKGLEYARDAMPYLERAGTLLRTLTAKMHYSVFLYMLGRFSESLKILYEIHEQIPAEPDEGFITFKHNLYYQLGILETLMGWPRKGLEFLVKPVEQPTRMSALSNQLYIFAGMGLAYYLTGEFLLGRESCLKSIELGELLEIKRVLGYAYAYLSLNEQELGLLEEAWAHARQAIVLGQTYGHNEIISLGYRSLGDLHMRIMDYENALQMYQKGIQTGGEHFAALDNLFRNGFAQVVTGNLDGFAQIEQVIAIARPIGLGGISVPAEVYLGFLRTQTQQGKISLEEAMELRQVSEQRSMKYLTATSEIALAQLESQPQHFEAAISWLQDAIQKGVEMSDPWIEILAIRILIPLLNLQGQAVDEHYTRLHKLIHIIDGSIKNIPLTERWQAYKREIFNL